MQRIVAFLTFLIFSSSILWAQSEPEVEESKDGQKWQSGMTPAQQLIANTGEDLLTGGNAGQAQTVFSGYGDASVTKDFAYNNTSGQLDRIVLFVGHQFNKNIAFFSELEVANARVSGGELLGEVGMEQAFMKFSINPRQYFLVGLILPRIGITNELHLPVNFNGTQVPFVEKLIIPTTWSELGVSFFGQMSTVPIQYSIGIMNGLDGSRFQHGSGIGSGVSAGKSALFNSLAINGSLRGFFGDFQVQVSAYYSGTVSANSYVADSLGISSGIFAHPVILGEASVQYNRDAWNARLLGAYISHPDAGITNVNFANNTPNVMYGAYGELSYDFLYHSISDWSIGKSLLGFVRYENLDMNYRIPDNGIEDGTLKQQHLIAGFSFFPVQNVVIKADYRYTSTGPFNPYTVVNPPPLLRPYPEQNHFLSVGIGYSF